MCRAPPLFPQERIMLVVGPGHNVCVSLVFPGSLSEVDRRERDQRSERRNFSVYQLHRGPVIALMGASKSSPSVTMSSVRRAVV